MFMNLVHAIVLLENFILYFNTETILLFLIRTKLQYTAVSTSDLRCKPLLRAVVNVRGGSEGCVVVIGTRTEDNEKM
jgi:hypothetical protein